MSRTTFPFKKAKSRASLPFDKGGVVLYKGLGARESPRGRGPQILVK